MSTIELPQASIDYQAYGPEDSARSPVVFVHAFLMNGTVWTQAAELLAERGIRSYAPDWPLGGHRIPVGAAADQSPRGVARQILYFLDALDLHDVTLVGSDTGGALVQFLLDTDPRRIGSVILTNCDAFDVFPPFPFSLFFRLLRGGIRMRVNLLPLRIRALRHSAMGFGLLAQTLDAEMTRSWIEPSLNDPAIRDDAVRFLRAADPHDLLDVSTRLAGFDGQVRIVWGMADRAFSPELGRRLQKAFAHAEFIEVPRSRTLVQLDEPAIVADAIAGSTAKHHGGGAKETPGH